MKMTRTRRWPLPAAAMLALALTAFPASADDAPAASDQAAPEAPGDWNLHGQFTNVTQYHPDFRSPFQGANSLSAGNRAAETMDATLFAGLRLWSGAEFYVNPEIDQGFGLSNTLGVAGYVSGEAYKIGQNSPYARMPRAFLRQTIDLGGSEQKLESGPNQLPGTQTSDNIVITAGKFSLVDIFDNNSYAHDPRSDFLNWSIIDAGAFDYAADAWGYTNGITTEWTQSWWTVRGGVVDLSTGPNDKHLEKRFQQFALVGELEERHELFGHPGKVKLLVFDNRGRMADYRDAVSLAQETGGTPDLSLVRHYGSRPGAALNFEQELASDFGVFARASVNDGNKEAFDFTEINQSVSAGLSLKGNRWDRPDDTVGLAGVVNGISNAAREYFAAGGLGILIGDGKLPHYGLESIAETYYALHPVDHLTLSLDYQFVVNPAYDRDRGPVSVFGLRFHFEI